MRKHFAWSRGGGVGWGEHSFVFFSSFSGISEIVIEALKFTEHFSLIMHHQTVLPRLTLSAFLLLSRFSAAERLDVLSQLVRDPSIYCSVCVKL